MFRFRRNAMIVDLLQVIEEQKGQLALALSVLVALGFDLSELDLVGLVG